MEAVKQPVTGFQPFNLVLTITSEEEARAIYAIFNHTKNCGLLKPKSGYADGGDHIREALGREFGDTVDGEIANGVTYDSYYLNRW